MCLLPSGSRLASEPLSRSGRRRPRECCIGGPDRQSRPCCSVWLLRSAPAVPSRAWSTAAMPGATGSLPPPMRCLVLVHSRRHAASRPGARSPTKAPAPCACSLAQMRRPASASGLHRRRPTRTRVHAKAELRPVGNDGRSADDTPRLEIGESRVSADLDQETSRHAKAGQAIRRATHGVSYTPPKKSGCFEAPG